MNAPSHDEPDAVRDRGRHREEVPEAVSLQRLALHQNLFLSLEFNLFPRILSKCTICPKIYTRISSENCKSGNLLHRLT